VGFHGTANSGNYGQDEAFYVGRPGSPHYVIYQRRDVTEFLK
jgi:hypothetical protein